MGTVRYTLLLQPHATCEVNKTA